MRPPDRRRFPAVVLLPVLLALAAVLAGGCAGTMAFRDEDASLRKALTFHASFDHNTDADFALGDPWLYTVPGMNQWTNARPGLPANGLIRVDAAGGKFGGGLRFEKATEPVVFYRANRNVPWSASPWSGTVSFWLRTDLSSLAPGFTDPLQVTSKAWNDAAFFVEFERREKEVPFRFGAYADYKVWNPLDRKWEEIPFAEKPLVAVAGPPFSGDQWTHVAFTWSRFNSGRPDGTALLYLDGAQVGSIRPRTQTFTWNPATTRMLLGVGFVGWIDEVAVFDRALTVEEIQKIRRLPRGIRSLRQ